MVLESFTNKNFNQEENWDVYTKDYTEDLVENDAIEPYEAGFLQGYNEF